MAFSLSCNAALTLWRIWLRLQFELNIFQFSESQRIRSGVANEQEFFNLFKTFLILNAVSVEQSFKLGRAFRVGFGFGPGSARVRA